MYVPLPDGMRLPPAFISGTVMPETWVMVNVGGFIKVVGSPQANIPLPADVVLTCPPYPL